MGTRIYFQIEARRNIFLTSEQQTMSIFTILFSCRFLSNCLGSPATQILQHKTTEMYSCNVEIRDRKYQQLLLRQSWFLCNKEWTRSPIFPGTTSSILPLLWENHSISNQDVCFKWPNINKKSERLRKKRIMNSEISGTPLQGID